LNRPEFQGAKVLIAGPNFGTGSSREHAVWALLDYGFDAVISPRFGDIFKNNSTKAGLVAAQVDEETGARLLEAAAEIPFLEVTIDVATKTISAPQAGITATFELDDFTQYRFLEGLDDVGLTLRNEDKISAYEARRPAWMPVTTAVAAEA
jgi:3-isopropylmalate/(R)-2-methylmalate dehydratase small subunit